MTLQSYSEGYRIEEHIGPDALESVRSLWEQWQTHPNADFDFFSTVVKYRPGIVNPVALVIFNKDTPVALAACRLEKVTLPISFGYMKISRFNILQLTVVYGGLLGAWDESVATVFIHHLRQLMRRKHIDAVYLAAMRLDNPVYEAANRCVPFFLRDSADKNNLHWGADLPDTFEAFQKRINSKHRTQLRSKERRLAEHCGGTIRVKVFCAPDEVSLFCTTAEKIAQATYLRGIGAGFHDNGEMRKRLDLAARKQWMRGYILYADEKSCAFWLGTLYRHIFYLDYTGFNSDLKDFAAGQILFIKMIEALCNEGGIHGIDFGSGDAEYKQRYGDRNWKESDCYLFNAAPAMLLCNTMRKSVELLHTVAAKILKRFDLFTRIKKRWRLSAEKSVNRQHVNIVKGDQP